MKLDLSFVEFFDQPIEVVWKAVSESAALAQWLMDNDFEGRVGHRFAFRHEACAGERGCIECEVLEFVPPRRLKLSWLSTELGQPTIVLIELDPHGSGTRLSLRHTGETDADTAAEFARGWPSKLAALHESLNLQRR